MKTKKNSSVIVHVCEQVLTVRKFQYLHGCQFSPLGGFGVQWIVEHRFTASYFQEKSAKGQNSLVYFVK